MKKEIRNFNPSVQDRIDELKVRGDYEMTEALTKEGIKYMIARLLENANEAAEESRKDKDDPYCAGRKVAYYEMLDIMRTELDVRDQDLKEFGLDIDLENKMA